MSAYEKKEHIAGVQHNGKYYKFRVFRIILDSGEEEFLITNVSDEYFSYEEAGELYFKRWKIETKFDSLKEKLELENMSGRRQAAALLQHIKIFGQNLTLQILWLHWNLLPMI